MKEQQEAAGFMVMSEERCCRMCNCDSQNRDDMDLDLETLHLMRVTHLNWKSSGDREDRTGVKDRHSKYRSTTTMVVGCGDAICRTGLCRAHTRGPPSTFLFTLTSRVLLWRHNVPKWKARSIRLSQALLGYGQIGALDFLYALLIHLGLSLAVAME